MRRTVDWIEIREEFVSSEEDEITIVRTTSETSVGKENKTILATCKIISAKRYE